MVGHGGVEYDASVNAPGQRPSHLRRTDGHSSPQPRRIRSLLRTRNHLRVPRRKRNSPNSIRRQLRSRCLAVPLVRKRPNGRRIYRKRVIETIEEYSNEVAARSTVASLITEVNWPNLRSTSITMTVAQLCSQYLEARTCGSSEPFSSLDADSAGQGPSGLSQACLSRKRSPIDMSPMLGYSVSPWLSAAPRSRFLYCPWYQSTIGWSEWMRMDSRKVQRELRKWDSLHRVRLSFLAAARPIP